MSFTLRPATGNRFIGREALVQEMIRELSDPDSDGGFALSGQRRIGKTSILLEVGRRLGTGASGVVPVYFSVWSLLDPSLGECARMLSAAILDAYRQVTGIGYRARDLMRVPLTVLRNVLENSTITIAYHDLELLFSMERETDEKELFLRALHLGEQLALATQTKCVLMIDEFPAIMDLKTGGSRIGEQVLKTIRTIQEQWRHTVLCITGSIRSTMDMTVLSATSPFYRQLIVRDVGPLSREETAALLRRDLPVSDDDISRIYAFSGGIPFYIQFMGRMIGRAGRTGRDSVGEAEEAFLREEGALLFRAELNALGPKERLIVAGIAAGQTTPAALAAGGGERVSNISRFLGYLREKGVVERESRGVYALADPVFARWVRERD
ncbi:MAG: hypothetical protein JXA08_09075 [Methanomicrobiaceae archaeon]|nr:hypothetical protein [Methanomicrobiaceae archaeon]